MISMRPTYSSLTLTGSSSNSPRWNHSARFSPSPDADYRVGEDEEKLSAICAVNMREGGKRSNKSKALKKDVDRASLLHIRRLQSTPFKMTIYQTQLCYYASKQSSSHRSGDGKRAYERTRHGNRSCKKLCAGCDANVNRM
jgi:hypothetical protein